MVPKVERLFFGTTNDGQNVTLFRISNRAGSYVEVLDYGCTIRSMYTHRRDRSLKNIICGYNTLQEYETREIPLGSVIVEGDDANDPAFCIWKTEDVNENAVTLRYLSDKIDISVQIRLMEFDRLVLDYAAVVPQEMRANISHQLFFDMDDNTKPGDHSFRIFTNHVVGPDNVKRTVQESGFSSKDYTPLLEETSFSCLTSAGQIHPFAEITGTKTELSLSTYSTMEAMQLTSITDPCLAVKLEMKQIDSCLRKANSPWNERTVYGVDLLYHEGEGNTGFFPLFTSAK